MLDHATSACAYNHGLVVDDTSIFVLFLFVLVDISDCVIFEACTKVMSDW